MVSKPKKPRNVVGKASCVASSWFSSWGAKVEYRGQDLVVDGQVLRFAEEPTEDALDAKALASNSVDKVLGELHKVSEKLGYGKPRTVRILGDTEEVRASKTDYEAVAMRLTQFVRTANPPPQVLREYAWIVKREAQRAHRRHYSVFTAMSMTWEDIYQMGMVLAVNHYHHYMTQKWDSECNNKFLVHHLQQGLERVAKVTALKAKNILFSGDGVPLDQQISTPIPGAPITAFNGEYSYELPESVEEPEGLKTPAKARQIKARAVLTAKLSEMPHDSMVLALETVVKSTFCDYSAREHARKMLDEHRQKCGECIKTVDSPEPV
jgi:hypothetical protein